jgi:hypothetical protein
MLSRIVKVEIVYDTGEKKKMKKLTIKEIEAQQTLGDKIIVILKNVRTGDETETTINPNFIITCQKMA